MIQAPQQLHVSDHAVLRYLERAHGLDIEALRARIAKALQRGADLGAPYVLLEGVRFAIRDGVVVSTLPRGVRTPRARRRRDLEGDDD